MLPQLLNESSISSSSLNVLDISLNSDEPPNQPIINFPRRKICEKQRSFQSSWYKVYPWIEYSVQLDAIFCFFVVILLVLYLVKSIKMF